VGDVQIGHYERPQKNNFGYWWRILATCHSRFNGTWKVAARHLQAYNPVSRQIHYNSSSKYYLARTLTV